MQRYEWSLTILFLVSKGFFFTDDLIFVCFDDINSNIEAVRTAAVFHSESPRLAISSSCSALTYTTVQVHNIVVYF